MWAAHLLGPNLPIDVKGIVLTISATTQVVSGAEHRGLRIGLLCPESRCCGVLEWVSLSVSRRGIRGQNITFLPDQLRGVINVRDDRGAALTAGRSQSIFLRSFMDGALFNDAPSQLQGIVVPFVCHGFIFIW